MGTVTPVVVNPGGYVRIEVSWTDYPSARKCTISRVVGGVETVLRDGDNVPLSGGVAVAFDHEMPLDVAVQYRSSIAINHDGDMEDTVGEFLTQGALDGTTGTVERTTDYYDVGVASAKYTPPGGSAAQVASAFVPVTAAVSYQLTMRVMLGAYWSGGVRAQLRWFDNVPALLGTANGVSNLTPVPGAWETYFVQGTSSGGATQARLRLLVDGNPPATLPIYVDQVRLVRTDALTTVTSAPVTVTSGGNGWWTDVLKPWSKLKLVDNVRSYDCAPGSGVVMLGLTNRERPADAAQFEVNDAKYPVGTWGRRKSGRQGIAVGTMGNADRTAVDTLHDSGAPLFLQVPARYRQADAYALCGTLAEAPLAGNHTKPWRVVTTDYVEQAPPVGPAEGTLTARYQDFTKLNNFGDAVALGNGGYDLMDRSVAAGSWGVATSGETITILPGGGLPADFDVTGGRARIALTSLGSPRRAVYVTPIFSTFDFRCVAHSFVAPTGGNIEQDMVARFVDGNNFCRIRIFRTPTGITHSLSSTSGGVDTGAGTFPVIPGATNVSSIRLHFWGTGSAIFGTAYLDGTTEPVNPTISMTSTHLTAGQPALSGNLGSGVSNPPLTVSWSEFVFSNTNSSVTWLDGLQGELTV